MVDNDTGRVRSELAREMESYYQVFGAHFKLIIM